jgi:hypothetical protein
LCRRSGEAKREAAEPDELGGINRQYPPFRMSVINCLSQKRPTGLQTGN